ncbi:MAG: hypothetical protein AABZ47_11960 [Planctomycetota bacterium]
MSDLAPREDGSRPKRIIRIAASNLKDAKAILKSCQKAVSDAALEGQDVAIDVTIANQAPKIDTLVTHETAERETVLREKVQQPLSKRAAEIEAQNIERGDVPDKPRPALAEEVEKEYQELRGAVGTLVKLGYRIVLWMGKVAEAISNISKLF